MHWSASLLQSGIAKHWTIRPIRPRRSPTPETGFAVRQRRHAASFRLDPLFRSRCPARRTTIVAALRKQFPERSPRTYVTIYSRTAICCAQKMLLVANSECDAIEIGFSAPPRLLKTRLCEDVPGGSTGLSECFVRSQRGNPTCCHDRRGGSNTPGAAITTCSEIVVAGGNGMCARSVRVSSWVGSIAQSSGYS